MERSRKLLVTIVLLVLFFGLPLLTWVATLYTDLQWFADVGYREVFTVTWLSRIATGAAFGFFAFLIVFANGRIARSMAPRGFITSGGSLPPQTEEAILQLRARMSPFVDKAILLGSLALGLLVAIQSSMYWDTMRLALAGIDFGVTDQQFGRDVGFYVFTLPALRIIADWLPGILILTTITTAAVHFIDGAIQPWARLQGFAPHVKGHISVLAGLIVASWAFDYWLRIWELNFSPRGQVIGASFTDVNAQLPALRILIVIAIISAFVLLVNIQFRGWRLPAIAIGVWIAASVLIGSVYPSLIQQFRVTPNEVTAEAPFIERNIAATREAFDLADVETRPFAAAETLTAQDVVDNRQTLDNVRLWDPEIISRPYGQLQIIRTYYTFPDVDVDRYEIDGQMRQVLVSVRELDTGQLPEQAQTWLNKHLVYTHGYGVVMSPVNAADSRGLPDFLIQDIPPQTDFPELEMDRPEVYFGEATSDYIIVNAGIAEFDYPVGERRAETFYEGAAGVNVGSPLNRVAFSLRLAAPQILFSQYIEPESRILFDRDITTRVRKLAPWLVLDSDPYAVLFEGRVVWVLDGYTVSNRYPYSEYHGGINYIRNSVKVTVDAYDGTTRLWAIDTDDPVLATWSSIFPGLISDVADMPEGIRNHFRYPQDLFMLQAEAYKNYHMTDPVDFYNKEDSWEIPGERSGNAMDPFYVLMRLPGEEVEDFQIIMPFTPRNRDNMIGWMAAKSDPADYGKRVVYEFPKQRVVLGPEQVSARINQDDVISPQLSLWSQRGSDVILGNMIVVPLEESVVYVQPLYLQAEQTAIPELTRVIVVYADKVIMAADLEAALLGVFGEVAPEEPDDGTGVAPAADAATAQRLYEEAVEAQRVGDWARYGRLLEELGSVLGRLAAPSVEVTPTP